MMRVLLQSLRAVLVLTVLTGVLYPLAVTVAARVCFKPQSLGSLVHDKNGVVQGSSLLGQPFSSPRYLWGRPSAAGNGYDATQSGGTNVTPVGSDTVARIRAERDRLKALDPDAEGEPPLLLVTTSASGLDPDISPEAALWQAPRIAKARGEKDDLRVRGFIEDMARDGSRTLGVLGEPRVNVLEFNRELDERFPSK